MHLYIVIYSDYLLLFKLSSKKCCPFGQPIAHEKVKQSISGSYLLFFRVAEGVILESHTLRRAYVQYLHSRVALCVVGRRVSSSPPPTPLQDRFKLDPHASPLPPLPSRPRSPLNPLRGLQPGRPSPSRVGS